MVLARSGPRDGPPARATRMRSRRRTRVGRRQCRERIGKPSSRRRRRAWPRRALRPNRVGWRLVSKLTSRMSRLVECRARARSKGSSWSDSRRRPNSRPQHRRRRRRGAMQSGSANRELRRLPRRANQRGRGRPTGRGNRRGVREPEDVGFCVCLCVSHRGSKPTEFTCLTLKPVVSRRAAVPKVDHFAYFSFFAPTSSLVGTGWPDATEILRTPARPAARFRAWAPWPKGRRRCGGVAAQVDPGVVRGARAAGQAW